LFVTACGSADNDKAPEDYYQKVSARIEDLTGDRQAELSQQKPRPKPRNIRIVIRTLSTYLEDYDDIDILWRYVNNFDTIADEPELLEQSGLKIGVAGDAFKVMLKKAKGRIRSTVESELFITVADGETGYISIGRKVHVLGFDYVGTWYNNIDYPFVTAERSFKAKPQILSTGRIAVELTPTFVDLLGPGRDLELTRLATKVVLRPGQMVVLAGTTATKKEDLSTALFGTTVGAKERRTIITLTLHLR